MNKEYIQTLRVKKIQLSREYQEKKDANPNYQDRREGARIASISRELNKYAKAQELTVLEDRQRAINLLEDLKHYFRGNTTAYNKTNDIYKLLTRSRGY